ncbi:uncharacterized threonine-rich GPI-anchored glycoprotein PJ4664.02-like isoform X2 [Toxotes jaculatrix]|uniref:uncharacterized threonine-rich GPI-anchored glycoprotein PJ4664.02-like isoform X2 n=1 Tax=Toxotes jaculatrix TaxID=941984 RepID=UPI001B3ABCFC|nr:uncharacterized threonine-rich GPI-anchored glycoprotein PJ4664.02-like isoform X2 [Toxotes jaculatrix]
MAISKNGLTIFALLVSLVILETGNFIESPCLVSPDQDEEHFLPHTRHRRSVLTDQWDYVIDVVVNASNAETFEQLQSSLNATGFPIQLDNNTKISDINITTVCSSTNTGFQCRCGEEFAWPYSTCVTYGVCDYITSGICKCINAIPADGQFCQPVSVLLDQVEYEVEVELNVTDVGTVDYLRSLLNNGSFSLALGPTVNVTNIEITTVCYPNGTSFQCRCEDQYVWSYTNCVTYGACDNITDGTCSCINSIPANGQYCQPKTVVPLYEYILEAQISVSDFAALEQLSDSLESISFPVRLNNTINITGIDIIFTVPPIIYEYQIFVEVNTTDADQLRNTLKNTTFPVQISTKINISATDITTVCSQNGTGFLCRCEDDYLWPCDKCDTYGKCDGDTDNTCSCIKAIPTDGQYCQSIQHQNLTVCPPTTTPPSTAPPVVYQYLISIELNISDVTVINGLRSILSNISYPISINNQIQISDVNISTVCSPSSGGYQCRCEDEYRWSCDQCLMYGPCDNITDDTCGCINALPPDGQYCQPADQYNFTACPLTTTTTKTPPSTTPPVVYQYLISIELNISDVTVLNGLRSILSNISYPISINNQIQISDVNISTVCSPSSGGYQCRCEDVYRWSCDQCLTYGPCDNITDDTCGCINALPPDGQYCQPADQYNFTACPLTTTPTTPPSTTPPVVYQYLISIELNISDVTVLNGLRSILSNISYPISINNQIQISDVNISTVCSPSSGGYQCRCEDVYRWSCDQCLTYGPCDNITDDTCGCINALPPDGQYCQPADQYNFTACPLTTTPTTPPSTTPPVVYQYLISIELNISDVTVLNGLRSILSNISYPISINNQIQISDVNISTVCSPSSGGYQCRCEDVYRWSCDQCLMYGPCDNITDDTCGCINALPPDGQYCQPADQYNFTACPLTTTPTTPPSTTPPVVYQYLISIELNISDVTVLNGLRSILSNISYPISINNQIQISDVNISTVCSPSSGGYQCRCEDVYRWSCDQCLMYGPCDNITDDTCGCINALPPDGQYCQPADQYNFTTCPVTTRSPSPTTPPVVYEYIISIELNTTDVTVINRLRNISFPISINNDIQVSDMNISTVCSPSSGGYQCRCEDVYRWSCDQCLMYGPCDNITDDTCGCINALPPDGQYCQPADQYNFTACPLTTTPTTPPSTTPPVVYQYLISIELNISDVTVLNGLRSILSNISYPISINNQIQISDVNISTVCSPSSGGYQCRCEDVYRWSCDQCLMYGPCDNITDDTCGCINALPPDGQYCQPADQYNFTTCPVTTPSPSPTTPPVVYEYIISIELNTTDVTVINRLRNISFPISINNDIQVSDMNISTVCSPSSGGYQCRCEDVYRWSCDQCLMYGPCDNITDDTCGCINALPPDGQYCQPVDQYNFTACPLTTTPTTPPSTTPPVVYQYLISIELNISDVTVINGLRSILSNISYPISINNQIQISDVNISTVCSPSSGGYQCRCEDVYRWSCDQCLMYGPCDNITDDTCGCINALPPDGQYCQPADQYNFTACPLTTTPTTPPSTTPPVVYQYLISIELNISDVTVINGLRSILSNISYPISINNQIQISDVNISTVCSPSSGGYQCRCEDVYRWSCDQCLMYGPCDNITDDTCGCINALPPDGQYCQPADQYNFTACPLTTTPTTPPSTTPPVVYQYLISIELNISDATVINGLRSILSNISYPISINNQIQISDVNISTVCSPSSGGYQCRCEDEYRWSCDQCLMYGPCDNITDDTCGCINALPPDGQYCQPVDQYNFTACPLTTTPTTPPSTTTNVTTTTPNMTTTTTPIPTTTTANTTTPIPTTTTANTTTPILTTTMANTTTPIPTTTTANTTTPILTTTMANTTTPIPTTTTANTTTPILTTTTVNTTTPIPTTTMVNTTTPILTTATVNTTTPIPTTTTANTTTPILTTTTVNTTTPFPTTTLATTTTTPITTTTTATPITTTTTATTTTTPITTTTTATPITTTTTATTTTPTTTTTTATTTTPITTTTTATTTTPTTTTTTTPITTTTTTPTTTTTTATTTTPTTTTTTATTTTPTTTTTTATTTTPTTTTTTTTTTVPTTTTTTATTTTTTVPTTTTTTTSTTASTLSTTTTTIIATTTPAGFSVEMSVRLDKEFTPGLNDESSSEYKTLKLQIETVLANQYKGIKGFISVIVTAFRPGSIITDFVVQTTQVDPNEIAEVNQNLPGAISSIAPVIGSVSASYNSPTPITIPDLTYTGNSMRLVCGPPVNIDVGQISRAVWTFKEREIKDGGRNVITTANDVSTLVINNVISADSGPYRCTLMGKVDFIQEGIVREDQIKQAPTVRLRSEVNVKCAVGKTQPLPCCVQSLYTVRWFLNGNPLISTPFKDGDANCIRHNYILQSCEGSQEERKLFICRVDNPPGYEMTTTMIIFKDTITCTDDQYGSGRTGDRSSIGCDKGQEGSKTAVCLETGEWKLEKDTCIVTQIKELLIDSQDLVVEEVPQFTMNLSQAVQKNQTEIAESSATISAIVNILNTIAGVSTTVSETTMQNVLDTVDVIIADDARESWTLLNANETRNSSSALLGSLETLSGELGGGEFAIATPRILLNRTTFNNSFRANLNSSIVIDIPETNISNVFITTITLPTLNNVMPVRNSTFNASLFNTTTNETVNDNTINAAVVLIKINETIQNVSLKYKKRNSSLGLNPQCVFWNFTLFDNLGAWDDEGCAFVSDINGSVTCSCNHLTSFSILMSTAIPPSLRVALDVITYVGVGISLASLVICLIIEGYVWKAITRNSTAFMRHVSIINTALSLLIADICFIIGASIANNPLENPGENYEVPLGPCSTATFFMHFFYLALFFWMLVSGLLLLYRTVMVFSHMSKSTMLAIGFSLGYGCPLIIAVITVAVTAPADGYIRRDYACWLNWTETKALLALVIPALTIVFINIIIVIVVLFKMLRRGVGDASQTDEKHTLVVITRCVIILTPLFGLTWALGVGTMISSTDEGVHIAFAFFNSLQGFFILVFGTLFDSKIRSILSKKSSTPSSGSNPTRSTSGGVSSSSGMNLLNRLRGRRYMYHISQAATSSSSGASESFVQI